MWLTSIAITNQRPENLSKRTCGSLIPDIPNELFAKKAFRSKFTIGVNVVVEVPVGVVAAVPVTEGLAKTFMRQLAVAITCVKPTSPQLSGGVYGDSLSGMVVP